MDAHPSSLPDAERKAEKQATGFQVLLYRLFFVVVIYALFFQVAQSLRASMVVAGFGATIASLYILFHDRHYVSIGILTIVGAIVGLFYASSVCGIYGVPICAAVGGWFGKCGLVAPRARKSPPG